MADTQAEWCLGEMHHYLGSSIRKSLLGGREGANDSGSVMYDYVTYDV